ncbi:hypothetical protein V6V47_00315 [Micromonospora sp. CPCC 205539]|uniref:hypothetical protein n=1 Tax=Micromonospora sp. CPCC 205539 TaxID=3122408 RepID=UPI002FF148F8
MRGRLLIGIVLSLTFATGCAAPIDRFGGDAAPAGSPIGSASPTGRSGPATASPGPSGTASANSGPSTPAAGSAGPKAPTTRASTPGGQTSQIRRTDWTNAVIDKLEFCGESDDSVTFRNGSNGADVPCRILPGGARPVYAEFVVEEPANAPSREDALILVELGNADTNRQQALVPVQLGDRGKGLFAWPVIVGERSSSDGRGMTFISYRVLGNYMVEATVRRLDGGTETRRWNRVDGSGNWERY